MSRAIFKETQSNQGPGLHNLFVDAVVTTAVFHLPREFSSPAFEYDPCRSKLWDGLLQNFPDHVKDIQKRAIEYSACKTRDDFDIKLEELDYKCPENIIDAAETVFSHEVARPLVDTIAGLMEERGLKQRAAKLRKNLTFDPLIPKFLEMSFKKYQDPRKDVMIDKYNEDEGSVACVGSEGPGGPLQTVNVFNIVPQIVRDGFGELKDKVQLRIHREDCECIYNNQVIMTCGPRIFEGLQLFRDAAMWIWLDLLLRHLQAEMRIGLLARLICYKPKVPDVVEFNETTYMLSTRTGVESSRSATTMSEANEQETTNPVNERYSMPKPSKELAPVVSALREAGFAQEAETFVKTYRFVRAASKDENYDLELPDGTRPPTFRQKGSRWFWYFTFMERLRLSKLFTFRRLGI